MNKVTVLSIISLVLLLSNLAMIGFIVFGKHPTKKVRARDFVIETLHFDDKQITAYELLIVEHRKAMDDKNQVILQLKNQLYSGLNQASNPVQKDSLLAEVSKAQTAIEQIHYAHFEALRGLCKENQQENFKVLTKDLTTYFGSTKNAPSRPSPKEKE